MAEDEKIIYLFCENTEGGMDDYTFNNFNDLLRSIKKDMHYKIGDERLIRKWNYKYLKYNWKQN